MSTLAMSGPGEFSLVEPASSTAGGALPAMPFKVSALRPKSFPESKNFVFSYCSERVTKSTTQSLVGGLNVKNSTVLVCRQSPPFFTMKTSLANVFAVVRFFNMSKTFTSDTNRQQHTTTHNTQRRRQHQRQRRRHNTAQHDATTQRHGTRYPPHTNTRKYEQTNKNTN